MSKNEQTEPGWRALEFFAGIGGFRCAIQLACEPIRSHFQIVAAIDIDRQAREIYSLNWPGVYEIAEIESFGLETLRKYNANFWWLSPPCQPYSRRGLQKDIDDPRASSLLHLISLIPELQPEAIALENVIGFGESKAHALFVHTLSACGYRVASIELCPTQMGWPNRRPRFYLLASRKSLDAWRPLPRFAVRLSELVSEVEMGMEAFQVDPVDFERFGLGMDRADPATCNAITACFGSSYGKSLVRSGSYLKTGSGLRRFTPNEVARQLGFPPTFRIPPEHKTRTAWRLLGNSLSIPAVSYVLSHFRG